MSTEAAASAAAQRIDALLVRQTQIAFWLAVAVPETLVRSLRALLAGEADRPVTALRRGAGRTLRLTLQRLGATFVKLGQIASTRPDLLPQEIIDELSVLQRQVPPFSGAIARRVIEEETGRSIAELFSRFDDVPVASASVSQVHRATLRATGEEVAVKVRRPEIVRRVELDASVILAGARLLGAVDSLAALDPVQQGRAFCDAIRAQLDFRSEARNNRRFREALAALPGVVLPRLYDSLCGERVLVMDWIDGVHEHEIELAGLSPRAFAPLLIEMFCTMVFDHGFVHADLHPGNLLFLRGSRVALFDLGMVADLDDEARLLFAQALFYLVRVMPDELAELLLDNLGHSEAVSLGALRADVREFMGTYLDTTLLELEVAAAIGRFFAIVRRHRLVMDTRLTVLFVSFITAQGLGQRLDPELNVFEVIKPWVGRVASELARARAARA